MKIKFEKYKVLTMFHAIAAKSSSFSSRVGFSCRFAYKMVHADRMLRIP